MKRMIKNFTSITLIASFALAFTLCATNLASELTVDQAIETALANNPSVTQLEAAIEQSRRALGQAKSARRPTLDTQLSVTRYLDEKLIPGTATSKFTGALSLNWPVYDPTRGAAITAARRSADASELDLARFRRLLEHQVYAAFTRAYIASGALDVEEKSLEYYAQLKRDARVRYDEGLIPRSDYLTFANAYDNARMQKSGYEYNKKNALLALETLTHEPIEADVELRLASETIDVPIDAADLEALHAAALKRRADVLASRSRLDALSASVRQAKGSKKPSVSVSYAYQLEESSVKEVDHNKDLGILTGQMNWRLSDGAARNHAIAGVEAQKAGAEARHASLEFEVRADSRAAWYQIENASERLRILAGFEMDAQENLTILTKRYKEGLIIVTTITDAEVRLNRARHNMIIARVDLAVGRRALDLATGGEEN